jgi:hypothetical protein
MCFDVFLQTKLFVTYRLSLGGLWLVNKIGVVVMGVYYYIVNEKHKELYELNKGYWWRMTRKTLGDVNKLFKYITGAFDDFNKHPEEAMHLAKTIIAWSRGSPMHVIADTDDENPCFNYPETASRYDLYPDRKYNPNYVWKEQ